MKLSRFSSDWVVVILFGLGLLAGSGNAIAQRPLGTDVYSGTGSINWTTVKNDGVSFAWAKAAEGTGSDGYEGEDSYFTINEANAKAAGVYIGAYYFCHPEVDTGTSGADTEAAFFWSVAKPYVTGGGAYLMPMLDVEIDTGTQTSQSAWVNEWCQDIVNDAAAQGITVKPVVYASTSYASEYFNSTVTQWNSWLAAYPGCTKVGNVNECGSTCPETCTPGSSTPWSTWSLWQYGDTNWSGGDSDVFNGTMQQFLQTYLIGGPAPTAPGGATLYWDPGALKASPGSGGTGNWDLSTADWWYSGTSNWIWSSSGDDPVFAGTAGTVTLNVTPLSCDSITFTTAGYTITGTGNALSFRGGPTISVPPPSSSPTYIDCILSGAGYTVTGGGVLVLNNTANTSGPANIESNSTLVITSSGVTPSSGTVTISGGGCLQNNDTTSGDAFLSSSFSIVMGTGGGYLNDNNIGGLSYGGVISGSGNLTKIGEGAAAY
jgi:GH25 family lysozyme M1 (1,4-beta-N-acetylmuramidase)